MRLMLVAAPAFVLLGAMGISDLLHAYATDMRDDEYGVMADAAAAPAKEDTKVGHG